jgi:hypothetical protein
MLFAKWFHNSYYNKSDAITVCDTYKTKLDQTTISGSIIPCFIFAFIDWCLFTNKRSSSSFASLKQKFSCPHQISQRLLADCNTSEIELKQYMRNQESIKCQDTLNRSASQYTVRQDRNDKANVAYKNLFIHLRDASESGI